MLKTSAAVSFVLAASIAGAQTSHDHLRIVAPAAPGGGWDQTARVMQQVLRESGVARTVSVENVPGAAGTIGLARFIGAERGRDDVLMVSGLIMLGGIVTHRSPVTLSDATPIARLTGEYEVVVAPAASPLRTLQDVIRELRARPESISWGGGSAGGSDQILAGLIADAVGVPPARINYIAFSGGGESLAAIVGGQVSVGVNGLAELAAQIDAGTVRVLAISSAERLPGLDAPTLREQGVDVVFENWRSVVGPPGLTRAGRDRLAGAVDHMVRSAGWRAALERYRWLDRYLAGDEFAAFTAAEEQRVRDILRKFGVQPEEEGALGPVGPYPMFVLAGLAICAVALRFGPAKAGPHKSVDMGAAFSRPEEKMHVGAAVKQPGGKMHVGAAVKQPEGKMHVGAAVKQPEGKMHVGAAFRRPEMARVGLIVLAILLNLLLAERAGFVIASSALFWLTARAFDNRRPVRDAIAAVLIAVASYVVFARVLDVSLPAGILERVGSVLEK